MGGLNSRLTKLEQATERITENQRQCAEAIRQAMHEAPPIPVDRRRVDIEPTLRRAAVLLRLSGDEVVEEARRILREAA